MIREPWYSRGIRQRLYNMSQEQDWRGRHAIHIDGYGEDKHIPYTQLLASSVFCLAVPGASAILRTLNLRLWHITESIDVAS